MTLPGGEEWLLKPVKAGLVKYTDLLDGSVGIDDIALLVDFLTVEAMNEDLARKALESRSNPEPDLGPVDSPKSNLELMAQRSKTALEGR